MRQTNPVIEMRQYKLLNSIDHTETKCNTCKKDINQRVDDCADCYFRISLSSACHSSMIASVNAQRLSKILDNSESREAIPDNKTLFKSSRFSKYLLKLKNKILSLIG